MPALTFAEGADVGAALHQAHRRLKNARIAEGMRQSALDRFEHAIINVVLVLLDHHTSAQLTDARIRRDSKKQVASIVLSKHIARLRAMLLVIPVAS